MGCRQHLLFAISVHTLSSPSKSNTKGFSPKFASTISPGVCRPTVGCRFRAAYYETEREITHTCTPYVCPHKLIAVTETRNSSEERWIYMYYRELTGTSDTAVPEREGRRDER